MRHSDLVVLGLLGGGPRHGYELTREIEEMRLRSWAKISPATVYRGLDRLEGQGYLNSQTDREGNRPERTVYRLTTEGEARLGELVCRALESGEPAYSDRLVGAVFSTVALSGGRRSDVLEQAIGELEGRIAGLRQAAGGGMSSLGDAILDFYSIVVEAEIELLETIRELEDVDAVPGGAADARR